MTWDRLRDRAFTLPSLFFPSLASKRFKIGPKQAIHHLRARLVRRGKKKGNGTLSAPFPIG